jgi:hypothetical protein
VTLTARHLGLALWCAEQVRESRATGKRVPGPLLPWNSEIVSVLKAAVSSSTRQESACGESPLESDVWIGSKLAARLLGWDIRRLQRRAADFDGRKVGARWIFPESVVREYTEGLTDERSAG